MKGRKENRNGNKTESTPQEQMKQILVTGGTGTLGREIIYQLLEKGNKVSVLTSQAKPDLPPDVKVYHGNLTNAASLEDSVSNATVIIHCASNSSDSHNVDVLGTQNLLSSISKEKLKHFIYISIVGVDKSSFPYYKAKFEVEKLVENSGLPYTILRATQFHDFILNRLIHHFDKGPGQQLQVPKNFKFQPIDIIEVAEVTIEITSSRPRNITLSIGGPEILTLEKMTQDYLDYLGRKDIIDIEPMDIFKVFQTGINLCPDNSYGQITWQQYLNFSLNGDTFPISEMSTQAQPKHRID